MCGKLIFHHGTVNSSKTMVLLSMCHNYESCGYNVVTIKPALDSRSEMIETRAGVPPRKPDIVLSESDLISDYNHIVLNSDVILVDECQFLTSAQVEELRLITLNCNIDVICFGLRTDSNTHLFDASKRLFELADEINEIKTICSICGKHASFNRKNSNNTNLIDPGWDTFSQVCYKHYLDSNHDEC